MSELVSNMNIQLYLFSYILAGIPFGYILAKSFAGVDIKQEGSGNIGATNVLRVVKKHKPSLAKKLGATTLFLDAIKGIVVLLIAKMLGASPSVLWTIAILAVWGHCFSIFLNFEGGKGVATGFGVLLFLLPIPSLIALVVWAICAKGLKISSLSSLIAIVALIIASYILYPNGLYGIGTHAPIWVISITIFYKHIPNIIRIFKKEESSIV